ncbi:hypothetical protein QYE76_051735 [Lolium multiflorum]|uniref:CCHC-type domain-containing protein n=1 Tax=Lolium multiflorum TaxID=4521 RepID=A0AAD8STZ3_LOLMU|nr:hypothetical protein QYE76_051735 [Lolium multiflorum]
MEGVEGMMKGLRLSEAERSGVKIGGRRGEGKGVLAESQAIGKLMAEKPAYEEAMENALGPLWCPMKGIDCKDLGDNLFLFTFHQAGGKKKAVDGGPWTFDKQLLVLEEYDPSKNLDDYAFTHIPIWVRIFKLPLGLMDRATGESVGNQIGEYMETGGIEDGLAVGKFLRVKVRKNILQPLMRGTMVEINETGRTIWCPLQYEYLPDFCYICGKIGHLDKECSIKLGKGEEPQFGNWLKWVPPKKHNFVENRRRGADGGGRKNFKFGSSTSGAGSDAPSWRKEVSTSKNNNLLKERVEREVPSPLKLTSGKEVMDREQENAAGNGKEDGGGVCDTNEMVLIEGKQCGGDGKFQLSGKSNEGERNSKVVQMMVDVGKTIEEKEEGIAEKGAMLMPNQEKKGDGEDGRVQLKRYKKRERKNDGAKSQVYDDGNKKRRGNEMEVDEPVKTKKSKGEVGNNTSVEASANQVGAGLSEQLRKSQ